MEARPPTGSHGTVGGVCQVVGGVCQVVCPPHPTAAAALLAPSHPRRHLTAVAFRAIPPDDLR
jgi:hypothetical protein